MTNVGYLRTSAFVLLTVGALIGISVFFQTDTDVGFSLFVQAVMWAVAGLVLQGVANIAKVVIELLTEQSAALRVIVGRRDKK